MWGSRSIYARVRFNHHRTKRDKEGHMLAMVSIALFSPSDVPAQDFKRWRMNVETLALHYEQLVSEAVIESGLDT